NKRVQAGCRLWFKKRLTSRNTALTDTEAEDMTVDKAAEETNPLGKVSHSSGHTSGKAVLAGSSTPNPNRESPQEKIVRKAESKAFLGEKKASFADIAAGKKTAKTEKAIKSVLSETSCAISEEIRTGRQVPTTDQCNVVFWDLSTYKGEMIEIKQAAEDTKAIGWTHRKQTGWLELAYATIDERDEALANPIVMPRNQQFMPIAPRKYSPQQIYIKLANVPIYPEKEVKSLIREYWSRFG